jgi:ABC-type polysaccharide/polyol phosphate transport system ATPase subunit
MDSAVEVKELWKTFQIPHEKRTTLFENLMGLMRPNQYETFTVLRDVSFQVEKGECIGIIGDNGSGKSTLLKIIANILRPSKGKVRVVGKMTPFLELGVGFQPDLTARENVGIYATIMGLPRKDIKEITETVMDFAELQKFQDTKLKNLSSGMQVRLAFSTAIQTNPDVLLVDEVLAVGDIAFQQKCFGVFNRYRKEGVTILFVSHDLSAIKRFCDRTLLLQQGRQVALGETHEVIDRYIRGNETEKIGNNYIKMGYNCEAHIRDGFFPLELLDSMGYVRWTKKRCTLNLHPTGTERNFYLKFFSIVDSFKFKILITQDGDGLRDCEYISNKGWQELKTDIIVKSKREIMVEIIMDEIWSPKELGINEDNRKLGISIREIGLVE